MKKQTNGDSPAGKVDKKIISDIRSALNNIKGWGSVEIFVQDFKVVQITERNIKKIKHDLNKKTGY